VANPTDPDSRIMKTRRGWVRGDNAQLVVTPQQIILASEVTTEAKDVRPLQPMLDQAQAKVELLLGEDAAANRATASSSSRRECSVTVPFPAPVGLSRTILLPGWRLIEAQVWPGFAGEPWDCQGRNAPRNLSPNPGFSPDLGTAPIQSTRSDPRK
jgi:hypothetical protein